MESLKSVLAAKEASITKLHQDLAITKQGLTAQVELIRQRETKLNAKLMELQATVKQKQEALVSLELKASCIETLAVQFQRVLQNKEDEVHLQKL